VAAPADAPAATTAPSTSTAGPASPVASPLAARGSARGTRLTVPDGYALVTSPRLPLFGVAADDPGRLLKGEIGDWRALGAAIPMAVEPLGLTGAIPPGVVPVATYRRYDELVAALSERPGGVALAPLEAIDYRVNVLAVEGFDPLRDGAAGPEPTIRFAVVGDIVPGRNVHQHMVTYGDYTRPFHKVADHLAGYDLTLANLEGNLSATLAQPVDPHSFSFVSDPAMLDGFKLAGIDAVSLANNHSVWNEPEVGWGIQGLLDTIAALEAVGLPFFGAGRSLDEARRPWITSPSSASTG
jgi:poly-gamma-glutamate synthesis protein (capsule biosynthesis protein)